MVWLLIISSMIVIWIAFLFKILYGSYSTSKGAFVNDSIVVLHSNNKLPHFERALYSPLKLVNCRCEIELKISSEGVQLSNLKPERVQIAEEADDNDDGEKEKDAECWHGLVKYFNRAG